MFYTFVLINPPDKGDGMGINMQGCAYGVGVGPGDPELMTLKAVRILRMADVIAFAGSSPSDSTAFGIAVRAVPKIMEKELLPIRVPMTRDRQAQEIEHGKTAHLIETYLDAGKNVACLTLGDPSIYSSFSYYRKLLEKDGYKTEMVSAVPSFCAVAAKLNIPLAEWEEPVHIIPALYLADKKQSAAKEPALAAEVSTEPMMDQEVTKESVLDPEVTKESVLDPEVTKESVLDPKVTKESVLDPKVTKESVLVTEETEESATKSEYLEKTDDGIDDRSEEKVQTGRGENQTYKEENQTCNEENQTCREKNQTSREKNQARKEGNQTSREKNQARKEEHQTNKGENQSGTYIYMKIGKQLKPLKDSLKDSGAEVYMVSGCGMEGEKVYRGLEEIPDDSRYFTTMIVKK